MDVAYLEIYSSSDVCLAPIETAVTLFTVECCHSDISVRFIRGTKKPGERAYAVDISRFACKILEGEEIPRQAASCELPNVVLNESSCVAGLCASLRLIAKRSVARNPTDFGRSLLGFKNSCLSCCSEASTWTRFCEVDLISTLKFLNDEALSRTELPANVARFERHMSQPVRLHNSLKYTMSKKYAIGGVATRDKAAKPDHTYAEGSHITLSDVIVFVCFRLLFDSIALEKVADLIPLTVGWYEKMLRNDIVLECLNCLPTRAVVKADVPRYTLPEVTNESLYKSDPKRYKPRNRIYTKQEDVEKSLRSIDEAGIDATLDAEPFGSEITFDWDEIPYEATPEGGSLPVARVQRKYQQLENLCRPVIKLARPGDLIVDFCSGSGHLGIAIACSLPDCRVMLVENKEESLNRAKERVRRLGLPNVSFCQSNLDYFRGDFDIGASLHACGVATDLVIRHCVLRNAAFVCCPCCYGSVCDCHRLTYPRSAVFRERIDSRGYFVLGHAADQTHDANNAKTAQGHRCMAIIDTDRKMQAEELGYSVYLAKLVPATCTPKNNLLVGIPPARKVPRG